ncbi:hypothetical protein ACW95P_03280 [Candidatus Mycoplasma pogonae]
MKKTNNNFKLQNLRKTGLFVLSTIPLIASSIAISRVGNGPNDWYDGESIMGWIENPVNNIKNLTPGQKEAFANGNAHAFGKNDIRQVESDMAELYQRYIAMKKIMDNPSGKYYPHFSQTEKFIRPIFEQAMKDAENALSNPKYNVINFVEIQKLGEDLYKKWNALDGFENILLKEVASRKVLTPAIKAYFNNWIIDNLRSIRENEMGERNNIDDTYLAKIEEWKKDINEATKKMEEFKAFINSYKIKKNEAKYQKSTPRLKEEFDNAIKNAETANISTPEIISEKQKIIDAWNKLDGLVESNQNLITLEQKIQEINNLDKLSNEYKQQIINLINNTGRRRINLNKPNDEYIKIIDRLIVGAKERNDQFHTIVEAFKNYQNTIGTIKYDEASNKLEEDTKVFKALSELFVDPSEPDGSLRKTADNYVSKSYDLQYFKLKFGPNPEKVQSIIASINQAKEDLNGVEEFERKKQALINKLNEEPLVNLNTSTKNDIKNKIAAAKNSSELSDIESKANDLNKELKYLKSVISDMETYKTNGEYTLATNKSEYDEALQSLKNKSNTNLFANSVDELSKFISNGAQAKTKLNGLEIRKKQLKDKLKTLPLSNLNQETKDVIETKINEARLVSEVNSLDSKATEIANAFKELKDKITEMESYKTNIDYTLSDENLKTAYDNALAALKTKNTTNIFGDTVDSLTNLVQAGTTAKNNLNGIERLQSQKQVKADQSKTAINSLNKLNNDLKNEFKTRLDNLNKTNVGETLTSFETKVNEIKQEATTLNNLFTGMNTALTKFRDKYHIETNGKLSTNWDTEKEKVLSAIDEVVTISLSRDINSTYDLQTNSRVMFKPGANATKVQEIISLINAATAALNGDVIAKQNALKAELAKEPFSKLNSAIIQKITQEINDATTLESLNLIETKINNANAVVKEINDKVSQLINMEALAKYKLASEDKRASFNTIKNNIESLLNQDLFEATKLQQAKETLKTFNDIDLDGDKNLEAAVAKLNNLTNIEVTQRTAIVTKAQNLNETDNKTKLDNLVTTFTTVNNDIATKQGTIAGLSHLSSEVQKHFKNQLSNIDPSLDKTQIDTKLAKDLNAATTLNAKFSDLEAKLKAYTDVIGTPKHNLATNKDDEDNKVIAELTKVLATPTVSALTDKTSIASGTLSVTDDTDVTKVINAIDNSLKALDGENVLKKQKTEYANEIKNQIKALSHLSDDLVTEFGNRISALVTANANDATQSLDDFKSSIDTLKTEANNLNNDYDKLANALQDYLSTLEETKYIKATNQNEQNDAVFAALNEVLEPSVTKPRNLTKDYTIAVPKIKLGTTTDTITKAVAKITAAKAALNGEQVALDEFKKELNAKLDNTPFKDVIDAKFINTIKKDIEKQNTLTGLDSIKAKIDTAIDLITKINQKSAELKANKTTDNYQLANDDKKLAFDNWITKIDEFLKKDIFDASEVAKANEKLATAIPELNGDINLSTSKAKVAGLENLSVSQKTQAETKLMDRAQVANKTTLDTADATLRSINNALRTNKESITNLTHVNESNKKAFATALEAIDITNISTEEAQKAIAKIVDKATALNNEFIKLKEALDQYTNTIGKTKHDLAYDKDKLDQDVLNALKSVLDDVTATDLTKTFDISANKLKVATAADVQTAITKINETFSKLNGDKVLENKINAFVTTLSSDENLQKLNDATKQAITEAAKAAKTEAELNDVKDKANKALENKTALEKILADLQAVKNLADYKLASTNKANDFDTKLAELESKLANENIYDKTTDEINTLSKPAQDAKSALDGKNNKIEAKNEIDKLTNINSTERIDIKTQMDDLAKIDTKAKLDKLVSDYQDINSDIGAKKTTISGLTNLTPSVQNHFNDKLENIDTTQDKATIKAKNAAIVTQATELNNKFTELSTKLKNYTDLIGSAKHDLATNKDAQDAAIIAAVNKILETPQLTTLTNTSAINDGKLSVNDVAKVTEAIVAIETAINALDGETVLETQKTQLANEAKTAISNLDHLSPELVKEFTDQIEALPKDNKTQNKETFEAEVAKIKTAAENLNNEYDKVDQALKGYLAVLDKVQYTKATNADTQDKALFDALNEILQTPVAKPNPFNNEYKIVNPKMKVGTTSDKITKVVETIAAAKSALNGEAVLKQQKTDYAEAIKKEIGALNHISVNLASEFDEQINKIAESHLDNLDQDLDDFKALIDAVKTTAQKLNNEYSKVNTAFIDYQSTIGTNAYDHATTKDAQNDTVFAALNTLVDPKLTKPATLTKNYKVDNLKLASGTTLAKITKAVEDIKNAKAALDGDQVVLKNKKNELKDLLKKSPLSDLPDGVKNKLKEEIESKSNLNDLDSIKDRIDTAKDVIEKVKTQITDLTTKKATPDYKLADEANKNNLDEALAKLNEDLTKDLFDQTNVDQAEKNIDVAKNVTLNGDAHLQAAKKVIDDLLNLSDDQKEQAKAKLDEIANSPTNAAGNPTSKTDLDAAVENFKAIDEKVKIAKNKIADLNHLNKTVINNAKDEINKINIKDLSSNEVKAKSDEIVNKLTEVHNQFDQLQTKLKKYTDTIGTIKHDLANDVNAIDQEIKNTVMNVIDNLPSGDLVKDYDISSSKFKTVNAEDIKTAIKAIEDGFSKLNGEQVLAAKVKELTDKLTNDANLSTLNQTTKAAIIDEANKAQTLAKLKDIEDKANQAVLDKNKLQQSINDLKTAKETANYKLADPTKQADFDSKLTELENALANDNLYDKTTDAVDALSTPAKNANNALDGNSNLAKALRNIEGMTNIPAEPQRAAIKSQANNLAETNSKVALDALVTKFTAVNAAIANANVEIDKLNHLSPELQAQFKVKAANIDIKADQTAITNTIKKHENNAKALEAKFAELADAAEKYKAAMETPKYLEADPANQISQNQKVQEALKSVLKDKTYNDFASEFDRINNETLKADTTLANVEAAIAKIKDALNSLDGTKQVDDVKKDLKDKVNNSDGIYNKLNETTKDAILDEINNANTDTKAEVNDIDQKAKEALDTHNKLTDKVKELEDFKNNPNYKLASDAEKTVYDNAITKLKEELNKNLLDPNNKTTSNTAMSDADAAKTALDGNTNLAKAKEEIDKLTNLPDRVKNDIKNNLDTIATSGDGSNSKLTDEVNKAKETAQKLADTIQAIDGQTNLSDAAKTALKDQAKAIDANNSVAEIAKKLDELTQKAKDLNDKFNDLKDAYNKYKDAMDSAKYKDATLENKTEQDEAVRAATDNVLDSPTTPSTTTELQGKIKDTTTIADLDQAIKDIEKALNNLDGDTELQKAKNELVDKTNPGNTLNPLNEATKNAIKEEVNNATSKKDIKEISDKANEALNTLKTIEEEIKKLNDAKTSDDYKLASDDKKQQFDEALKQLTNLKDSNLLDLTTKDKLDKGKTASDEAIKALDGQKNLDAAKKTIDELTNLLPKDREKAKEGIPTTSLNDLNKYVDDIKAINDEIKKQNDFIDKLPNLSDEAKAQAKDKIAEVVDLDKSKEENIENIQKVVANILDINNYFNDLREVIDNYLSVRQTPTYTASTNGVEQDQKFVNALNEVIAKQITNPDDNILNRFKAGVNEDKINEAIVKIKQATADLDGNIEVNKFKDKLIDMIDNDAKYKHLSQATKESLKAKIYAINPNESNWKEQLNIILSEAEDIITRVNQVLAKIVKLETLGATKYKTEITELKKILGQDWTRPIHLPEDELVDNQNSKSQPTNKLWWLLSLLGLIPLSLAALWAKLKKKK